MKELELEFNGTGEVKGYFFKQIKFSDSGYVYSVSYGNKVSHYEVFCKKINNKFGCISYPRSKSFGLWAWTYGDFESAIKKFNDL